MGTTVAVQKANDISDVMNSDTARLLLASVNAGDRLVRTDRGATLQGPKGTRNLAHLDIAPLETRASRPAMPTHATSPNAPTDWDMDPSFPPLWATGEGSLFTAGGGYDGSNHPQHVTAFLLRLTSIAQAKHIWLLGSAYWAPGGKKVDANVQWAMNDDLEALLRHPLRGRLDPDGYGPYPAQYFAHEVEKTLSSSETPLAPAPSRGRRPD